MDIAERPRRLRQTAALRRLVQETAVRPADLVLPVFVREEAEAPVPIGSMPGVVQHSESSLKAAVTEAAQAGVGAVMVFGVPSHRDACGDAAVAHDSILTRAVRWTKDAVGDDLPVIADQPHTGPFGDRVGDDGVQLQCSGFSGLVDDEQDLLLGRIGFEQKLLENDQKVALSKIQARQCITCITITITTKFYQHITRLNC